jgi:hypothetical protein
MNKNELLSRKIKLTLSNTILYKLPYCGTTSMILLFLQDFNNKEFLYINYNDLLFKNIPSNILIENIDLFLQENLNIKIVIIENAPYNIRPTINNIIYILSTNMDLTKKIHLKYKEIFLYPLDFEEYILFKKDKSENIFNTFIKDSTYPSLVIKESILFHLNLQNIINNIIKDSQEKEIFFLFLQYQGSLVSIHQLYTKMKKQIKISKDKFYEKSKLLENKLFLFLISKYRQEKSPKKTYFIDFNLPKAIKTTINFKSSIENAILLELIKQNIFIKDIYYTELFTFYIPNIKQAILVMIFKELEIIQNTIEKLSKNIDDDRIDNIFIITIDDTLSRHSTTIRNINYEILTFWEFATTR